VVKQLAQTANLFLAFTWCFLVHLNGRQRVFLTTFFI